jgi:hypothetical protein
MPEGLGVPELIQEYSAVTRRAFAFNIGPNLKPLFGQEAPPWETLVLKSQLTLPTFYLLGIALEPDRSSIPCTDTASGRSFTHCSGAALAARWWATLKGVPVLHNSRKGLSGVCNGVGAGNL